MNSIKKSKVCLAIISALTLSPTIAYADITVGSGQDLTITTDRFNEAVKVTSGGKLNVNEGGVIGGENALYEVRVTNGELNLNHNAQ